MDFAGSAILLVVLLLPGAVAIRAYNSSLITKQAGLYITFNELLIKGLIISLFTHCAAICTIRHFFGSPNIRILYSILIAEKIDIKDKDITTLFLQFCTYSITLIGVVFFLAKFFKFIVQKKQWDLKIHGLKNSNYWFEVFSARYLEIKGVQGEKVQTDLIFIDVLAKNEVIYSGFLHDFNYSSEKGVLENIILRNTSKRVLQKNDAAIIAQKSTLPYLIPGDIFLIKGEEIYNINISYIKVLDNLYNEDKVANTENQIILDNMKTNVSSSTQESA